MLVTLFLTMAVVGMFLSVKRKSTKRFISCIILVIVGALLEVAAPDEMTMTDQKQLMVSVIDSNYYVLFSQNDNKAICRYEVDSDWGWEEVALKENYTIIQEVNCTKPRIEKYRNKVIGLVKISLERKEETKLYVPINTICNL